MDQQVIFRVDSSTQMGSGHLMRCLTLAGQLKKKNEAKIAFITRDLEGNLNHLIMQQGYQLFQLPSVLSNESLVGYEQWLTVKPVVDAEQVISILQSIRTDWLVIDSYALGEEWEVRVRPYVQKIMVIDDLANRRHNCNILLDQNYYCDMKKRYVNLVPSQCKLLLGPQYALLREEFYKVRRSLRVRDGLIRNILVYFGGSDLTNETMKTICALTMLNRNDIMVNVVVGGSNKNKEDIHRYCRRYHNMQYFCQVDNMASLMNEADLAIGAGGSTTWERCFLLLPSIVITIADNQQDIAQNCQQMNLIEYLGKSSDVSCEMALRSIKSFVTNQSKTLFMQNQLNSFTQAWGLARNFRFEKETFYV